MSSTPKQLATLAGAGATCGALWASIVRLTGSATPWPQSMLSLALLGAFLFPWIWLFYRALRAERILGLLVPPAILTGAALLFFLGRDAVPIADRYRSEGIRTKALVTDYQPRIHNSLSYQYEVHGTTYQGGDFAPVGCDGLQVGDSVVIAYLRSAPEVSAARIPNATSGSVLLSSLLGASWLGTAAVNLGYYLNRRKRSPPTIRLERAV